MASAENEKRWRKAAGLADVSQQQDRDLLRNKLLRAKPVTGMLKLPAPAVPGAPGQGGKGGGNSGGARGGRLEIDFTSTTLCATADATREALFGVCVHFERSASAVQLWN